LGLSDRHIVQSPSTCTVSPALPEPSDLLYVYYAIRLKTYSTGLCSAQIYLTQKYESYACTLFFRQRCLAFCLLPHTPQKKRWYSVPHWAKW